MNGLILARADLRMMLVDRKYQADDILTRINHPEPAAMSTSARAHRYMGEFVSAMASPIAFSTGLNKIIEQPSLDPCGWISNSSGAVLRRLEFNQTQNRHPPEPRPTTFCATQDASRTKPADGHFGAFAGTDEAQATPGKYEHIISWHKDQILIPENRDSTSDRTRRQQKMIAWTAAHSAFEENQRELSTMPS